MRGWHPYPDAGKGYQVWRTPPWDAQVSDKFTSKTVGRDGFGQTAIVNSPRVALNPFGGREAGKSSATHLGDLAWKYKRAPMSMGTNRVCWAAGTQLPLCCYVPAASASLLSISAEAGAVLPTPLHSRRQPCPAGAGCCLSPEPDGAVTLGSSGPSPQLSDPVGHLPLLSPGTGSAVPQPASGAACATARKGTHSSWLWNFGTALTCPAWDTGILWLSGNLFC